MFMIESSKTSIFPSNKSSFAKERETKIELRCYRKPPFLD